MNAANINLFKIKVVVSFIIVLSMLLFVGCVSDSETTTEPVTDIIPPVGTNVASRPSSSSTTPFNEYDKAMIDLISSNWYGIISQRVYGKFERYQPDIGKIVVRYRLNYDGFVTNVQVMASNMNRLYDQACVEAIKKSVPFSKWPPDMVKMFGTDYRDITFTFYYEKNSERKKSTPQNKT
jgi:TonB family protein